MLTSITIRVCRLERAVRVAQRLLHGKRFDLRGASGAVLDADDMGRQLAAAGRQRWVNAACLPQAFLLWVLLGIDGHPAELVVGVTGSLTCFGAHAWVELEGRPVSQPAASIQPFAELSRWPVR